MSDFPMLNSEYELTDTERMWAAIGMDVMEKLGWLDERPSLPGYREPIT